MERNVSVRYSDWNGHVRSLFKLDTADSNYFNSDVLYHYVDRQRAEPRKGKENMAERYAKADGGIFSRIYLECCPRVGVYNGSIWIHEICEGRWGIDGYVQNYSWLFLELYDKIPVY